MAVNVLMLKWLVAAAIALFVAITAEIIPEQTVDRVVSHVLRNQSVDELPQMSNRARDWASCRTFSRRQSMVTIPGRPLTGPRSNTYFTHPDRELRAAPCRRIRVPYACSLPML